jgi:hypothetical protein
MMGVASRFLQGLTVAVAMFAAGPSRTADSDGQSWTLLAAQGHVAPKVRLFLEAQPRVALDEGRVDRLILRGAVGCDLSRHASLWLGYGWTPLVSPDFQDEQRPFQQLLLTHRPAGGTLINRTRLEQRLIEGADLSLRLRHLVRFLRPVADASPWRWIVSDEVFVNLNAPDKGPAQGFDQNRLFAGVGLQEGPTLFEAGYLHDFIARRGKPDLGRHVALLAATLTWP